MTKQARLPNERWHLCLYVAEDSASSALAIVQLKRIAAEYLPAGSRIEIIDLFARSELAEEEQIIAIPTLIRKSPLPVRRVIGNLGDIDQVLISLGFTSWSLENPFSDDAAGAG